MIILGYFVTKLGYNVKRAARASGPLCINEKPEIIMQQAEVAQGESRFQEK